MHKDQTKKKGKNNLKHKGRSQTIDKQNADQCSNTQHFLFLTFILKSFLQEKQIKIFSGAKSDSGISCQLSESY